MGNCINRLSGSECSGAPWGLFRYNYHEAARTRKGHFLTLNHVFSIRRCSHSECFFVFCPFLIRRHYQIAYLNSCFRGGVRVRPQATKSPETKEALPMTLFTVAPYTTAQSLAVLKSLYHTL